MILGVVMLLVGIVWFLQSVGFVDSTIWGLFLPLILIFVGISILMSDDCSDCLVCKVLEKPKNVVLDAKKISVKERPSNESKKVATAKKVVTKSSKKK